MQVTHYSILPCCVICLFRKIAQAPWIIAQAPRIIFRSPAEGDCNLHIIDDVTMCSIITPWYHRHSHNGDKAKFVTFAHTLHDKCSNAKSATGCHKSTSLRRQRAHSTLDTDTFVRDVAPSIDGEGTLKTFQEMPRNISHCADSDGYRTPENWGQYHGNLRSRHRVPDSHTPGHLSNPGLVSGSRFPGLVGGPTAETTGMTWKDRNRGNTLTLRSLFRVQ